MRVLLPQTAEIRTIPKSLLRSFQNNFKCLFFKRLYQIDEILKYKADETLVADTRGAVWNFPCMKQGVFKAGVRIPKGSEEVYLLLNDRWMNPSDTVARYECMYELKLSREQLGIRDEKWHEISISWDLEQKNSIARVQVDGKKRNLRLQLKRPTLHGISYAHFMACPANENPGIEVEWVKASKKIK